MFWLVLSKWMQNGSASGCGTVAPSLASCTTQLNGLTPSHGEGGEEALAVPADVTAKATAARSASAPSARARSPRLPLRFLMRPNVPGISRRTVPFWDDPPDATSLTRALSRGVAGRSTLRELLPQGGRPGWRPGALGSLHGVEGAGRGGAGRAVAD